MMRMRQLSRAAQRAADSLTQDVLIRTRIFGVDRGPVIREVIEQLWNVLERTPGQVYDDEKEAER